ncbi:type II toxin-antitoxin system death-on-curing family toxin [Candidatus Nomurabacteria bacterium]|nr:type II toxin-antitoxin system death-on-curing family toxin [Candidatus Nomurabacteria bacterium]
MDDIIYPNEEDFRIFINILQQGDYSIKKYLPHIDENWYDIVVTQMNYVKNTSYYEDLNIYEVCSKILYKITKKHELGDGNKRSGVICVVLFCLVNNFYITKPSELKNLARKIAKTRGRKNENKIRKNITPDIKNIIELLSDK